MKVQYKATAESFDVVFVEERSAGKWFGLITATILTFFGISLAFRSDLKTASYIAVPMLLAVVFSRLYVLFGLSKLQLTDKGLVLKRSLFFLRRTRSYQRQDVEKLSYQPELTGYQSHQDSGLSLMVRQNVTPVLFARTLLPQEATEVLEALSKRCRWLAPLIRPVGALPN